MPESCGIIRLLQNESSGLIYENDALTNTGFYDKNPSFIERFEYFIINPLLVTEGGWGVKTIGISKCSYNQRNNRKDFFIADFYCTKKRLVVELDGGYHKHQRQYDRNRDRVIAALGIEVLRINNSELHDIKSVKRKILRRLEKL